MKTYQLFAMIGILFLLTGCQQNKKDEINNMPNDNFAVSQTTSNSNSVGETQRYTDAQLSEIADYIGTKDELLSQYPTCSVCTLVMINDECANSSTKEVHRIIYCGETKSLMLTFDDSGNRMTESLHNLTVPKNAFETISVGSLLSEVQAIDPQGEYLFLYTGRNDVPRVSAHYTTDGFVISITYDKNNVIEKIDLVPM